MSTFANNPPLYRLGRTSILPLVGTIGTINANYFIIAGDCDVKYDEKEDSVLRNFELAKEIMEKIKKIIKYAEDNKLDVQETLESFFNEEELGLYENFISLKIEVEEIKMKRQKEKEEDELKQQIEKYRPYSPYSPWQFPHDTIYRQDFDEETFVFNISKNIKYTHSIN